jgi:anti-anti-sigma factor
MPKQEEDRTDGPLGVSSNRYGQEVMVVSLTGELDQSNVSTAKEVLGSAARTEVGLLVIDLYDLRFLDSSGIAMLVELTRVRGAGALRILPSPARQVTRMLDLTGIGSLIRVAADGAPA